MARGEAPRDRIPERFESVGEAAEFWDAHDLGDYWEVTEGAGFEVDLRDQDVHGRQEDRVASDQQDLQQIITQAERLSPEDRLRLIQRVAETLLPAERRGRPHRLVYGQFRGARMSTDEDFSIAEWRPNERELDAS